LARNRENRSFLSFGRNNINNKNGNRGSNQRPVKRKKQDFHRHKISRVEDNVSVSRNDDLSFKEKTILSLDRLGQQLFSGEPGGYSFEKWMNSFNRLLDEFEERVGRERLPKDYFEKRLEVTSSLLNAIEPSGEVDSEISKLREEELALRNAISAEQNRKKLEKETKERKERLKLLEEERNQNQRALDKAKNDVAEKRKLMRESTSLIKRLFGSSPSSSSKALDRIPLQSLETRVVDIETKIQGIERKILELGERIKFAENTKMPGEELGDLSEIQSRLEMVSLTIEELEKNKFEDSQMLEKRKEATRIMRELISKVDDVGQREVSPPVR
jgi:hypothetical protein